MFSNLAWNNNQGQGQILVHGFQDDLFHGVLVGNSVP